MTGEEPGEENEHAGQRHQHLCRAPVAAEEPEYHGREEARRRAFEQAEDPRQGGVRLKDHLHQQVRPGSWGETIPSLFQDRVSGRPHQRGDRRRGGRPA